MSNTNGSGAPEIDFLKDDPKTMTLGRRFAMRFINSRWYNPASAENDDEGTNEGADEAPRIIDDFESDIAYEKPCLKKGWAYFEHNTLYRYMVKEDGSYDLAIPGEKTHPTRLYPWFRTPHSQMGDFGLGVGLFFSALRYIIFVTYAAGLISLGNILYFASDEYGSPYVVEWYEALRYGSAICGIQSFEPVPCPNCTCRDPSKSNLWVSRNELMSGDCAYANSTDGQLLTIAARPTCDATHWQLGASNFASIVFVAVALLVLGWHLKREQEKFDEDEQTAQDYSVQIKNPPADAKDTEEWRRYFLEKFGAQAAVCTCAIPNDELLRTLIARRELLRKIYDIRPGHSLDMADLAQAVAAEEEEKGKKATLPKLYSQLLDLRTKVKELSQKDYPVKHVYVTFETEVGQRKVLKELTTRRFKKRSNDGSASSKNDYLFRGDVVLHVREPEEPDMIRWLDLDTGSASRLVRRTITLVGTLLLSAFAMYVLVAAQHGANNSALVGFIGNIFPIIVGIYAGIMVVLFESHPTESSKELSAYSNGMVMQLLANAFFPLLCTPFGFTVLSDISGFPGLISIISMLFFIGILLYTTFGILDISGNINRHIHAPRAKTQDAMNILFQGKEWSLPQKYQGMMGYLFMCTFYSSIFPTGYFYVAVGLTIQYFLDKRMLLRTCKRALSSGTVIAKANRLFYYPIIIACSFLMSSYFWAGFPFDSLCATDDELDQAYIGTFDLELSRSFQIVGQNPNATAQVTFDKNTVPYRVCNQNFFANWPHVTFPYVPTSGNAEANLDPYAYMTDDQLFTTTYFGWTAVGIIALMAIRFCWSWYRVFQTIKYGRIHQTVGDSQGIPYSSVKSRRAYIPEVKSSAFAYPLIGCDIEGINEELFHFTDPLRSYKYYDLTKDVKKILETEELPACFTVVKSWDPDTKE